VATNTNRLSNPKARLYLLGGFLFLWIAAISLRLFSLQVVQYHDWLLRAQKQQQRSIELTPARGIIYDRNGRELAMSVQVDSIFAVPSDVPDHATAASLLAEILGTAAKDIQEKLDSGKSFVWIARKVNASASTRVRELNLKGIYFQKEPKRFYPKRELAAQVLGYVGLDDEGLGGVELNFDDTLRGIPGRMQISLDARRRRLGRVERQPEAGQNLVLTIDQNIQYIAERELERAMQETHAEAATIVVQNPHTGEILALANRPTFNPNTFARVAQQQLKNRAISDVYEPGSVFKIVTLSAALEEKLTRPDEVVDCQMGAIVVNGMRIRDHEKLGLLTVSEVLAKSSDVGAIKIGMRLGDERFARYIRAYGFGSATRIELPGETRGLTKPVKRWSKVSIGAISMGQEIGVTPIQIASMVSTIAHDGVWNAPRIVAGVTPPNSGPQTITFRPAEQRRVVSPLTAVEMKKMLEGVVLFGTGRKAILDGYTSAGKTGTAQKVDPRTGRYSTTKYVGSFVGFAPVNQPAITVVVIIDSAVGLHQGGQVAAPVFQRVTQQVLEYLHVSHDAELKNQNRLLLRAAVKDGELEESSPDHPGDPLSWAELTQSELAQSSPAPDSGTPEPVRAATARMVPVAIRQPLLVPTAEASAIPSEAAPLIAPPQPGPVSASGVVVNVDGVVVPTFVGKSLRACVETAQGAGIVLNTHGSGLAREQSPAPGTRVPPGGRVAVRFAH
jgi:cell division protein FtsI (penicillin-binding protein 3)